jgi:hypothetical protein
MLRVWTPFLAFVIALSAQAGVTDIFRTPLARYLFTRTSEGVAVMARLGHSSPGHYEGFLERLAAPELAQARAELEAGLRRTSESVAELRRIQGRRPGEGAPLTAEERFLVETLAGRRFRIDAEWRLPVDDPRRTGPIEFYPESGIREGAFSGSRQRFLAPEGVIEGFRPSAAAGAFEAEASGGTRRISRFFERMKNCRGQMPRPREQEFRLRYLLTSVGISETFTVGSYIITSGEEPIDWKNLSADMLVTALSSAVGTRILMGDSTGWVRWLRITAFGEARAGFDAVYYYLTPIKNTRGKAPERAALERLEFNTMWTAGTSWIPLATYELLSGLECLHPGAKMVAASTGIRLAISAGSSLAYFSLRRRWMD